MKTTKCCWNKKAVILCMLPPLLIYLLLTLIPSFLTFLYSFTNITRTNPDWSFVGLENYRDLLMHQNARDTLDAVKRTLIWAVVVTIVQNTLALLMAVVFNSKVLKGRNLYRSIVFLPYVLGATVCCYTWVLMTGMDGPVMELLDVFGIKSALLGSPKDAFATVMFIQVWLSAGYAMVLDIAGLQGIPQDLYEAASIDGASPIKQFFQITIPLLWSTLSINILLSIIGSLGSVQSILLTTGGAHNTETLAMRIYRTAFKVGAQDSVTKNPTLGYAASQSMLLFVIVLVFALFTRWIMNRKEKSYEM